MSDYYSRAGCEPPERSAVVSGHPSECPVCHKLYMPVHYDGVPTWIHMGKCVQPDGPDGVDDDDYILTARRAR